MLRIHFTDADLARTRVATAPDPLWETLLGLHQLTGGRPTPAFAAWRERARTELMERGLRPAAGLLLSVAPPLSAYFPDFLTPPESSAGLDSGLEAIRATPAARVRQEVTLTARVAQGTRRGAAWTRSLAEGNRERLQELTDSVRAVHRTVIAPCWSQVDLYVDADRALRARALRDGGVAALLSSLGPRARWDPPVLRAEYPVEYDLHLGGRGLLLVPSYFCWVKPVALADPGLPPVLVYPVDRGELPGPARVCGASHATALAQLLGRTRARVLALLEPTATTGEIARRLEMSAATASGHVRALREAELAGSLRDGGTVLHTLTPLGTALLHGELRP